MSDPRVRYPDADQLDTEHRHHTDGYALDLYLVPAAETDDGIPRVATHDGVGQIGTPMPAWHHRWASIGRLGAQVIGDSVREALESIEDELVAASEAYLGSEWDGSNLVGSWAATEEEVAYEDMPGRRLAAAWEEAVQDYVRNYWDAGDWYGPAGTDWEELCRDAGIDPERALDDDWESVVEEVAEIVEEAEVSGTADYARDRAERYRETHIHCQCGRVTDVRCDWVGDPDETVLVEWMPRDLRASHEAAGNRGTWPANGAERLRVQWECADRIVEGEDGWAEIVW